MDAEDCAHRREEISARLDGELDPAAVGELHAHLQRCASCRRWEERAAHQHRATRVRPVEAVPDLTDSILAELRAALRLTLDPDGTAAPGVPAGAPTAGTDPAAAADPATGAGGATGARGAARPGRPNRARRAVGIAATAVVAIASLQAVIMLRDRAADGPQPEVAIVDGLATSAPAGGQSAVYLSIVNDGGADRLVDADSPVAEHARLHSYDDRDDGLVVMRRQHAYAVPEAATVALQPGGAHVMLEGMHRDVEAGERVEITLHFERSGARTVEATVTDPGEVLPAVAGPR